MAKKLRIGIIGAGGIGRRHARAYMSLPNVVITGVCDIVPGRANEFIVREGIENARGFSDLNDLLEAGVDAVSVCTPNVAHHDATVAALEAGAHVLVEKPMAVTLDQAVSMVRAARKAGRILTVGFQTRYDPNTQMLNELVQAGVLGDVYYVETGGGRRRGMPGGTFIRKETAGAGAVADVGCYALDLVMEALGHPRPLTASAATYNHFGTSAKYHPEAEHFEVEDFGCAFVRFEGGLTMVFKTAWAMHMDSLGAMLFLGTEAGLKLTPAGSGPWGGAWDKGIGSMTLYHDIHGHHTASPIPLKEHTLDVFTAKVKDFVRAIQQGDEAPISGEQILLNQAIIDAVLRSAELRKEVAIHIPEI